MEAGVILVAAGEGRRFGGPKAFLDLEGRSLLERAAEPFASFRDRVAVLRREDLPRARLPGWKLVVGGPRRRDSVESGLAALDPGTGTVLVHDAARPLASAALVARVLEAAARHPAVVPAVPLVDTVKKVRGALVEGLGEPVATVAGDPRNLKVTTPEDLDLLRALLRAGMR
jgi:2-C-methyl-D-erythritol 4-phosphate cytidylyltransferase